jgi:hypothetical protein
MAGFVATKWGIARASKGANNRSISSHQIFSGGIPSSNRVHQRHQAVKLQSSAVVQLPNLVSQPHHLIHLRSDLASQPTNKSFQTFHLIQQPMDDIFQRRRTARQNCGNASDSCIREMDAFFKRSHKASAALTVQEMLDEQMAMKQVSTDDASFNLPFHWRRRRK